MTLGLQILNPGLLYAGTALASIPIIIHLLNRLRYKRIVWAAMEFLLAAHRKNARRVRIEHLILLVIRTLIILLLAAAVGRPILEGLLARLGRSAVHRVLGVEDSFSMGARYGVSVSGETVIKEARKTAQWLMETFAEHDGVSLVAAGSRPHVRIGSPSVNRDQVLAQIEKLSASDSATDMVGALDDVKKILAESRAEQKVVYILTDNLKPTWHDESGRDLKALASAVAAQATVIVVDLSRGARPNLAIRSLEPERPVVTAGILAHLRVEVENLGDDPVDDVVVNMTVDGQRVSPVVFGRLGPRRAELRKWPVTFDRPGEHTVAAALKESSQDAVEADSRRYLALAVKDALHVLLVDGQPRPGFFQNETDYLRLALDPRVGGEERETDYLVKTVRDSELDTAQFEDQDVICVANVAGLSDAQIDRLKRFVADGGSLMVFVGDQVRTQDYNRLLYEDGKGLLPAALGPALGTTEPGQEAQYTTFDVRHFDHPAMAAFKERSQGAGLNFVTIYRYLQLKLPAEAPDADVILYLEDGNPGLVEKKFGRGRAILWATTADTEWNNFPRTPGYLELVHEIMAYMAPDVLWRYNRLVDAGTELPVGAAQSRDGVVMTKPRYATETLQPEPVAGDRFALVLRDLDESGLYRLEGPGFGPRNVAANVDTRESDLDHLTKEQLADQLGRAPFLYAAGQADLADALKAQQAAGGWSRNLLYGMLALLLVETLLAWLFNRGR